MAAGPSQTQYTTSIGAGPKKIFISRDGKIIGHQAGKDIFFLLKQPYNPNISTQFWTLIDAFESFLLCF